MLLTNLKPHPLPLQGDSLFRVNPSPEGAGGKGDGVNISMMPIFTMRMRIYLIEKEKGTWVYTRL
jgi:hypothetical protein